MNKELVPQRIRQARISRGFDEHELALIMNRAFKFNLSNRSISRFEMGLDEPDEQELSFMARVLDYPMTFFYKPMPPENSAADGPLFICSGIHDKLFKRS